MKKIYKKWLLPLCLLLIIFTQLVDYYFQEDINPALLVVVVALLPGALKGLEYNISKKDVGYVILQTFLLVRFYCYPAILSSNITTKIISKNKANR